jgi:vitamin B12 transporter
MKQILSILLITTTLASAEIPQIDIRPAPNTSSFASGTVGKTIITQKQFADQNFTDVKDVLNYVGMIDVTQSGPRGQQTSVFTRGTNSNHTLVLLNGIPINDASGENGAYDFGQDFLQNLTAIEVYRGPAAAHFGPDAIGGAINLITAIDYQNKMTVGSATSGGDLAGNYYTEKNGWRINVKGGVHASKSESALSADGADKDGVKNKSIAINTEKQINDNWTFWSSTFGRNTFALLDGHSSSQQVGYDADNTLFAQQLGFNRVDKNEKSFITLHTHAYDREYTSPGDELDNYKANAYTLRAEHQKQETNNFSWGLGTEYRNDFALFQNRGDYTSEVNADYNTTALYGNIGYQFTSNLIGSVHLRSDNNSVVGHKNSAKVGLQKNNVLPKLNLRTTYSIGHKTPSLYELFGADNWGYTGNRNLKSEESQSLELAADYNIDTNSMFTVSLFQSNINHLIEYSNNTYINSAGTTDQSGIELAYSNSSDVGSIRFFATSLSSEKTDGSAQLRRPEFSLGTNLMKKLNNDVKFIANYKFTGEYFDTHNSNWSTITMPETHLLDVGLRKDFGGYELGFNVSNILDQNYQKPHGFSQNNRRINFVFKRTF